MNKQGIFVCLLIGVILSVVVGAGRFIDRVQNDQIAPESSRENMVDSTMSMVDSTEEFSAKVEGVSQTEISSANYAYYLVLEEHGLMVYHFDRFTLYLDTGIMADELTMENQALLKEGIYIRDTAGLFDFLQTVTS